MIYKRIFLPFPVRYRPSESALRFVLGGTCTAAPSFKIGVDWTGDRTPQKAPKPNPETKRADRHTSPDRTSPAAMSVLVKLVLLRRVAPLQWRRRRKLNKMTNRPRRRCGSAAQDKQRRPKETLAWPQLPRVRLCRTTSAGVAFVAMLAA
jgi:hypothetical protein